MTASRNYRITTTQGMSGHFAVMIADYEDMDWNPDIVTTGIGRYRTRDEAVKEAKFWANSEEIPYVEGIGKSKSE